MGYQGYFVKIIGKAGSLESSYDYIIPMSAIVFNSYKSTYSVLDDDSKRTGKGRLRRKTYPHRVAHCKFTLRPLTNDEFFSIFNMIQLRYVKTRQRKVKASIWVSELNDYVEDYYYVPDTEVPAMRQINSTTLKYDSVEMELIGY